LNYRHASLFTGIMGFDLAAEAIGWDNIFALEKDNYCRKLIKQNMPYTKLYDDIYNFNAKKYEGQIDILTGGFPCQPFSVAGNRNGTNDDRYLWPEMFRVTKECRPTWIIAENVAGIVTMGDKAEEISMESQITTFGENNKIITIREQYILQTIIDDLEREGFDVQTYIVPALAVGAKHRRNRIWIVGYSEHNGLFATKKRKINEENDYQRTQKKQEKTIKFKGAGEPRSFKKSSNCTIRSKQNSRIRMVEKIKRMELQRRSNRSFPNTTTTRFQAWTIKKNAQKRIPKQFKRFCKIIPNTNVLRRENRIYGKQQVRKTSEFGNIYTQREPRWKWPTEPTMGRVANGIPNRVDRVKSLGNAIVPQVAYEFFYHINLIKEKI